MIFPYQLTENQKSPPVSNNIYFNGQSIKEELQALLKFHKAGLKQPEFQIVIEDPKHSAEKDSKTPKTNPSDSKLENEHMKSKNKLESRNFGGDFDEVFDSNGDQFKFN